MIEFTFPGDVALHDGESFSFTLAWHEDESIELVDYRYLLSPAREAAEVASLEQDIEEL